MSELRFNELRGEPVVYAIHRQDRTFLPTREHCPLCPTRPGGPETEIPLAQFEIVVFENRFPAFEAPSGTAEVIVYTDDHELSLATLPPARVEALMWVWRQRYEELGAREDVEYVYIFENRGVEVGVTLHHPHGQIYAYPFIPPVAATELGRHAGGCLQCQLIRFEITARRRLLINEAGIVAYVPESARWPYEVHVTTRAHRSALPDVPPAGRRGLLAAMQRVTRAYDRLFEAPMPYMMAMHQSPAEVSAQAHLHVEFYPILRDRGKLKYLAGSESGAGVFINDTLAEESADRLRSLLE